MDPRIIELEKKISFQEADIAQLTAAMVEQFNRIEVLERELKNLKDKWTSGSLTQDVEDEQPPPHY